MAKKPRNVQRFTRKVRRGAKLARWTVQGVTGKPDTAPILVFGMQRSGTRLLLDVLGSAPGVAAYYENHPAYYDGVLLREERGVAEQLRASPFPRVALKPICESHRAREFLERSPAAQGVWIFRGFRDSVNSAAAKWSTAREHLHSIATGDWSAAGWRAGGLTAAQKRLVRSLYHDDMTEHAAQAVMWHVRNTLFFDQRLQSNDRLLLVRYEDLVHRPEFSFEELFDFLGLRFRPKYVANVYTSSVNARSFPSLPEEILQLCEATEQRLEEVYSRNNHDMAT